MSSDNKSLGRFELTGIPPAPRGVPQIEVTFDIDANGILNVSAKDMSSGKQQTIKITAQSGLSEEEIKKAVQDAELHKAEDEERQKAVAARNNLDNLVYQTEKLLKENSTLPEADVKPVNEALAEAKKVLENKTASLQDLEASLQKVQTASHKITSELYQKASQQQAGADAGAAGAETAGASASGGKDDVIDADFKDV
jgi:molecular chaperone DnaK